MLAQVTMDTLSRDRRKERRDPAPGKPRQRMGACVLDIRAQPKELKTLLTADTFKTGSLIARVMVACRGVVERCQPSGFLVVYIFGRGFRRVGVAALVTVGVWRPSL